MSGGFRNTFTLSAPQTVTVSFRYNLTQSEGYEADEISEALVTVDSVLFGIPPNDYVAQLVGDGNGGGPITTGWQQVTLNVGTLGTGLHTVIVGAYNGKKTAIDETTNVLFDDLVVAIQFAGGTPTRRTTEPTPTPTALQRRRPLPHRA
jgi:hypothetical protein